MNKIVTLSTIFLCLTFFGCLNNFPEEELIKEINSGTYQVSGTQVELEYDFPWPSWGGEEVILSRDTTEIEFTAEVKYEKGRQDSVRFIGLAGAERAVVSCRDLRPECEPYARLNDSKLTFEIDGLGGYYNGNGSLGEGTLILETHFEYRSEGVDYHLQGEKIDE